MVALLCCCSGTTLLKYEMIICVEFHFTCYCYGMQWLRFFAVDAFVRDSHFACRISLGTTYSVRFDHILTYYHVVYSHLIAFHQYITYCSFYRGLAIAFEISGQ